ncbi:hypothetical protein BOTCAL_0123g00080 [Botryotinia calthae]|uniref:Methyltransferase type 11 domain-containing protein n=1 Tax=Botryotinia calthae TaxID=38488 RepID=A0A4Y8D6M7_9HELO|nr:hypothetical protein BOTCAL_0123g00080 [Botryotinia calthae]
MRSTRWGDPEQVISLSVGTVENAVEMFAANTFDFILMNPVFAFEHYSPQSERNQVLTKEPYRVYAPTGITRHLTQDTLQSLLQKSEVLSRTIDLVPHQISFPNYDRLTAFEMANIFGNFLDFNSLPEELRDRAKQNVIKVYQALDRREGIPMTVTLLMAIAKKF